MFCFVDMDGVIADFVGGVCRAHNRSFPYDESSALGIWDIEKLWGMTAAEFWEPCNNDPKFWDDLDRTPEADLIISLAISMYSLDNVAILTAPSMDLQCVPGKRRWMKRHFPMLEPHMIFAKHKKFLGGSDRLLIDDKSENIDEFVAAGGEAVIVPRAWNSAHHYRNNVMRFIDHQFKSVRG